MRIGELSGRTNVSRDALRLYEKRGLIKSDRGENGYRDFDHTMIRLVDLIKLGQKLGFSLRELKGIVNASSSHEMSADDTADLLRQKLAEVDLKINEMSRLRSLISDLLGRACPL